MEIRQAELSNLVMRSLTNMRATKTQFLPLSMNLSNAAALEFQIKVRDAFLCDIRRIRSSLGARTMHRGSPNRRFINRPKGRGRRGATQARMAEPGVASRQRQI